MPQLVEHTVKVDDVKVGDFVPGYEFTVASKVTKQKYVYLFDGENFKEQVRAARGVDILVKRSELTDDELRAKDVTTLENSVAAFINAMRQLAKVDVAAQLNDDLAKNGYDVSYTLHWKTEGLLVLDAKRKFAAELVSWLDEHRKASATDLDVVLAWHGQLVEKCVRAVRYPARSTSVMANLEEQCAAQAAALLIDAQQMSAIVYYNEKVNGS